MIILMSIMAALWVVGILLVVLEWKKDCKEIGKENLAVPLKDR